MPLHRKPPAEAGEERGDLLADLVAELTDPKPFGQPVIIEDDTPETNSLRVQVAWDRWEDCPREARSGIVTDAYEHVYGPERRKEITLALGLTIPEAAAIGLLPFQVVPGRHKAGQPSADEYRQAMVAAGASVLSDAQKPELRCATLDDAQTLIEHLEQALPNSKWIIVHHDMSEYEN